MAGEDDNPTVPLGDRGSQGVQHTQPLPDPSAQWVLSGTEKPAPAKRRRTWPWLVAGGAAVIIAAGAIIAEPIASGIVTDGIRQRVIAELDLPADQQIDVNVSGLVLPQLIIGTLGEVTLSAQDVSLQGITGDVSVSVTGVPVRGDGAMSAGEASIALDQEQLRALLSTVDGFPAESLGLDAPDVTMSTELNVFGLAVPVGVSLTPSAAAGDLVLTPDSIEVSGVSVSADQLRDQFGVAVNAIARDWPVCIAEYLPAGLTLTSVSVEGEQLVAGFDIDGRIVSDPALLEDGTCA